ncbi:MAG: hypothetical protein ACRD3M_12600, partial [Thermoanaerobaculia bacterium]
ALAFTLGRARADSPGGSAATADFSGGGTLETATARPKGKLVRVELASASGKRLDRADAPSPGGRPEILLSAGSIGSAGALLEVVALADARVCRSVWRFRDGALTRLPVREGGQRLPDCEAAGEWSTRWEKTEDEPARYVRERTRDVPQGKLRETRVFAFAGFALERDVERSGARINGVPIPAWYDVLLYRKSDLEPLFQRFGLAGLRRAPRLSVEADREAGVFALRLSDGEAEVRLPVTGSRPLEGEQPGVELSAGEPPVRVRVTLARGSIPREAVVEGAGGRRDGAYAPAFHWSPERLRVYPDAEQELASEALPGVWASETGARIPVEAIPGAGAVRFGGAEVSLSLDRAPEGADLLLVPRDGSAPLWALRFRGPNAISRLPVLCAEEGADARNCRIAGAGEALKRVGSQLNVR